MPFCTDLTRFFQKANAMFEHQLLQMDRQCHEDSVYRIASLYPPEQRLHVYRTMLSRPRPVASFCSDPAFLDFSSDSGN